MSCPRCGYTEKRAHQYRGEPCHDRATCPVCHMTVYVGAAGKLLSHKHWSGEHGRAIECEGVGQRP